MHRARPGRGTYTAPDRQAAASLRTNREDNQNHVPLHRRRLHNRVPIKLLQDNDPTMNRRHASWPTPYRPGKQGSKSERRPVGWGQHAAPRLPTAIQKALKCFQHCVFDVPLLLLAAGVRFLLFVFDDENMLLLKYNQSRITQARDKKVEEKQDQSMKGCSHKESDKESLSTIDDSNKHPMQLRMKYLTCLRDTDWKTAPRAHTLQ